MKKLSVITFLMIGTLLFFGNISTSYAEEVHSKVTGTLVQPDETTDTDGSGTNGLNPPSKNDAIDKKYPKSDSKKDNYPKVNLFSKLPQTGGTIKWEISLVGVLLVVMSLIVILVKRRRNSNEKK